MEVANTQRDKECFLGLVETHGAVDASRLTHSIFALLDAKLTIMACC